MFYVGNKMEIGEEFMLVKIAREQQFFTLLSTTLYNARVSYNMQSAIASC